MQINLIFRKAVPSFFSIEKVFDIVSLNSSENTFIRTILPFTSRGLVSVIFNLLYLSKFRKGYFHITGDVHYAMLVLPRNRTILTFHDLIFLHTYKGLRRFVLKYIFLDLPVKRAKWITAISEKSKREIIQFTGCDANKIQVIANPIDNSIQFLSKQFTAFKPVLLFLGTKENKNLEVAIAALFRLNLHLRIIGDLTPEYLELLGKYNIDFSNDSNISKEQLSAEYAGADIVYFPSVYEGFGLPLIESFQAGRPVLSSNISPITEIAEDAALLVDPYSISSLRNGILRLIDDEKLRIDLVQKGFEVVKKYQPEFITKEYELLWKKLKG